MSRLPSCVFRSVRCLAALCLCAAVALACLGLAGCGDDSAQRAAESITQGIEADVEQLQNLTSSTASELFNSAFSEQLTDAGIRLTTVYGPLFEDLTCTVKSVDVSEDGTSATAHLTVTNRDLAQAFENYQQTLTDALASEDGAEKFAAMQGDDAAFLTYLMEEFASAVSDVDLGTVSFDVDIVYQLENDVWKAQDLTAFQRAVLGGLDPDALEQAAQKLADEVANA